MSRNVWPQVDRYENGQPLDADTLNHPVSQLGERTEYLFARYMEIAGRGPMSAVTLTGVELAPGAAEPEAGNAVYADSEGRFAKAVSLMSLYDDFKAAAPAFSVGILTYKNGTVGNVALYGAVDTDAGDAPINAADVLESGEEFRPGRYFLSSREAGKLTADPSGPVVYVCTVTGSVDRNGALRGSMMVNPQFMDVGTSHIHRSAALTARPAGTKSPDGYFPSDPEPGGDQPAPLALRFGGAWTADRSVSYSFRIESGNPNWVNGDLKLYWSEDGAEKGYVTIPAPGIPVPLSNGVTVALDIPSPGRVNAFNIQEDGKRKWNPIALPEAGSGWTRHLPLGQASSGHGWDIALSGRLEGFPYAYSCEITAAYFRNAVSYRVSGIADGTSVSLGDKSYVFGTGAGKVPVGADDAESAMNLVKAIYEDLPEPSVPVPTFSVLGEGCYGSDATYIVATESSLSSDALHVAGTWGNILISPVKYVVLFDSFHRVVGNAPVQDLFRFQWSLISAQGGMPLRAMLFIGDGAQAVGYTATMQFRDDEPDALYDYAVGFDQQVAKNWPPVPPKSAALCVNGVEMDNKALFPDNPTVSFGPDTIHWFENEDGRRPWPDAFSVRGEEVDPSLDKFEVLHWVRGFQGATGPVTSLQPKPGSPLRVYGYGTEKAANTGDLEIDVALDFSVENRAEPGYVVPKRVSGGVMVGGPVVERVRGGVGVAVVPDAGCPDGQGSVTVSLDGTYSGPFSDIALENAEQAKIGMFPYIRLKGYTGSSIQSPSAFTATVRVPPSLPDGSYSMRVSASVFGEASFEGAPARNATVSFEYNILPDLTATGQREYSSLKGGLLKPAYARTVRIPFGHESTSGFGYAGFDPVLVTTDDPSLEERGDVVEKVLGEEIPYAPEFAEGVVPDLRPGYLVGVRFSRAVSSGSDPYTGAIGFINLCWSIRPSSSEAEAASPISGALDGLVIRANTPAGIRAAVEGIGERLGAEVVRPY